MAYILPNFSPTILNSQDNKLSNIIIHQRNSPPFTPSRLGLEPARVSQLNRSQNVQPKKDSQQKDDFYVNLGSAVRTLREDLPFLFTKDLDYDIYREDITFIDPLNTFTGIEKYKLMFCALRFHGRILFREISMEVVRIWQPSENMILIRWNLKGVPRVPWEAKGDFQGTSRYKLDRIGKIYEHKVDSLAFNFQDPLKPAVSVLDLVTASPNPTFLWSPVGVYSSSWVDFYRALKETLDHEGRLVRQDCCFLVNSKGISLTICMLVYYIFYKYRINSNFDPTSNLDHRCTHQLDDFPFPQAFIDGKVEVMFIAKGEAHVHCRKGFYSISYI